MDKLFPLTLAIIDVMAALVYFYAGDYRRGIYWIAASVLTLSVTL